MKQKFVLDENIVVFADTLTDATGHYDPSSFYIMSDITRNCHALVVDKELRSRYDKKFRQLQQDSRGIRSPVVTRLITSLQSNTIKYVYLENAPQYKFEHLFPTEDRFLARIAAESNATIVTLDAGVLGGYAKLLKETNPNFRVMSPLDASAHYFSNHIASHQSS